MRTCGRRQIDGQGNGAVFVDYVEEPSGVGAIITGDVELPCLRVEPDLVRATQSPGPDELEELAVFIEQDRLRGKGTAAHKHVAAPANGESGRRAPRR